MGDLMFDPATTTIVQIDNNWGFLAQLNLEIKHFKSLIAQYDEERARNLQVVLERLARCEQMRDDLIQQGAQRQAELGPMLLISQKDGQDG